jgi:DNA polymerase III alpha subunit
MPDFDVDFASRSRERVIDVAQKNIAAIKSRKIITYGTSGC